MIKFRMGGHLYSVRVADLRQELTRIMSDLWQDGDMTQASR